MVLETTPHQVLMQITGAALKNKAAAIHREFEQGGLSLGPDDYVILPETFAQLENFLGRLLGK